MLAQKTNNNQVISVKIMMANEIIILGVILGWQKQGLKILLKQKPES